MSGKGLKAWWMPYSNMITCQMTLDNDDESAQAMADIFELLKSQYCVFVYFLLVTRSVMVYPMCTSRTP